MNKGQREKPDGVVDGSKPTKSPIIKFFKIVGIIAIVIVLLIGISIAYVLYSDKKAEQERFDKTQAKAETWVSNRKPNLVLIRNDFGKTDMFLLKTTNNFMKWSIRQILTKLMDLVAYLIYMVKEVPLLVRMEKLTVIAR